MAGRFPHDDPPFPPAMAAPGEFPAPPPTGGKGRRLLLGLMVSVFALAGVLAVLWQAHGVLSPVAVLGVAGVLVLAGAAWSLGVWRADGQAAETLRAAALADPDGRLIVDGEGRSVFANRAFADLFPRAGTAQGSFAAVERAVVAPEAAEALARLRDRVLNGAGGRIEIPIAGEGADAPCAWRAIAATPIGGGHVLWTVRDVTARHELMETWRAEERRVVDLLDNLPVGFFSADEDGRFAYLNDTLRDWLGVMPDEDVTTLGLADFVLRGVDDGDEGEGLETGAEDGGERRHGEVVLRPANGGDPFRIYLRQSEANGEGGRFLYSRSIVLRDYAVGAAATEASRSGLRRDRALFADAPVGIVLIGIDGTILESNRSFLKMIGLHREAVVGTPIRERIAKEDRDELDGQLSKIMMGALPAARLELRLPGLGAREVATAAFASPLRGDTGEIEGFILHFIDTTDRKHLEAQFSQAQRIQAVGQLAGGIAHDFNNLLTAMIGFCDLLLTRHGPGDPSFADLQQIKQNANRAANLVRQLLAFSRRQTLKPKVIDVTDALSELSLTLRRMIGETVELRLEHGGNLGPVKVDPNQFDQVIVNLAVNARDAMPGGGRVSITTSAVTLTEQVQRGTEVMALGDYVLVEVSDTGAGIRKEDIGRIFEPFFTTKAVGAGTGLGLSTVYGIVRQTGGYVFVTSALGEGTTFSVYLPVHHPAEGEAAVVITPRHAEDDLIEADLTGGGTVLLVEDEDPVRLFASRALRDKGYTVIEAENGEAGLDALARHDGPIDLIVSDVVMPGMDGLTFVKLVRQEMPKVKVILISGYAEDAIPDEIARDHTVEFLNKPFSLKELASRVKTAIEG